MATVPEIKTRAISDVDFWETKYRGHRKELEGMMKKLIGKKQNKK